LERSLSASPAEIKEMILLLLLPAVLIVPRALAGGWGDLQTESEAHPVDTLSFGQHQAWHGTAPPAN
jgi:hypothetical protein